MADADPAAARLGQLTRLQRLVERIRANEPDLSDRQSAILLTACLVEGQHTVASLAAHLQVCKPVVTRALNTLGAMGLMRRVRNEDDQRVVFAVATRQGREFAEKMF